MKIKKSILPLIATACLLNLSLVYADAPVEDLSVQNSQEATMNEVTPDNSDAMNSDSNASRYSNQNQSLNQAAVNDNQAPQNNGAGQAQMPNEYGSQSNDATNTERLSRLEQQVSNMTNMNMPQQISALRQEVQQLNGRIQVQQHDIDVLKNQQRNFYKDLNNRLQKMNGGKPASLSGSPAHKAASASLSDSSAYRAAFNLLVKKKYDDAMNAFQDYIGKHPKGAFVSNAYYWMGELYLKRKDTEMATKSFSRIVSQYPKSNKVPDARLKLAIIHIGQGKKSQAQKELKAIKHQYPNSTASQLASIQLQRMAQ